ncbi:substrate-binding domain-containing protein [Azospirillum sp. ST 5-10]|uniref:substrate-binding domain-containing protein n=1 Tax=unclassified Azospirillum TaxID=2630922 RepID=UPI003F4A6817
MTVKFGIAAALAAGLALAAGGAVAQDKVKMGVSIPAATHGWAGGLNWHAQQAEKRLETQYPNLEIQIATARDAGSQANDLEDLVSIHAIDALVILPFESAPLTDPVREVKNQGKFVTVVDRGLTDPSIQDLYVAGNNPAMGKVSAEYFKSRLGKGAKIVVLRGIPTVIDNQRVDAFKQELEGSGIEILAMEYANWNRDDGFKVMQDFLSRFPKIDAVWAQDDDIALGVIEAVKQAGRENEMFVVGGAGMKDMIKRVMEKDKLVPVDVLYPPSMIADAMEITAKHLVEKAPIKKEYILDATLVTPENAEKYYYPDSPF